MSEQEAPTAKSMATPEDVKAANDWARKVATRPGWRAMLGVLAFVAGMAFYVTHFAT